MKRSAKEAVTWSLDMTKAPSRIRRRLLGLPFRHTLTHTKGRPPMGRTIPAAIDIVNVSDSDREVIVLDAETLEVLAWRNPEPASGRTRDRVEGPESRR